MHERAYQGWHSETDVNHTAVCQQSHPCPLDGQVRHHRQEAEHRHDDTPAGRRPEVTLFPVDLRHRPAQNEALTEQKAADEQGPQGHTSDHAAGEAEKSKGREPNLSGKTSEPLAQYEATSRQDRRAQNDHRLIQIGQRVDRNDAVQRADEDDGQHRETYHRPREKTATPTNAAAAMIGSTIIGETTAAAHSMKTKTDQLQLQIQRRVADSNRGVRRTLDAIDDPPRESASGAYYDAHRAGQPDFACKAPEVGSHSQTSEIVVDARLTAYTAVSRIRLRILEWSVNLVEVLRVVRERRLIIVSGLVLGMLGAVVATHLIPQMYSAQVTMFVAGSPPVVPAPTTAPSAASTAGPTAPAPATTPQLDSVYQANELAQARMSSYVQLLTSDRITAPVVQALNLAVEPSDLAGRMTVSNVPNTVVLTVAVTDQQPERAAQIANAVAEQFVGLVKQLGAQSGSNQISVALLQPASVPTQAVSPRPLLNLGLGAGLGLLLGLVGAFVRDSVDTTFRSRESLADATGAPTLGVVPYIRDPARQPLMVDNDSKTSIAEAFRQLRTNLYFSPGATQGAHHVTVDTTLVNLVVTSSVSGEGATSTVCNLAIAEADAGRTVLVIDANLRSPGMTELFALKSGPGLAEVLIGGTTLEDP